MEPHKKFQRLIAKLDDELATMDSSVPDALLEMCNRGMNVMGKEHENLNAHKMLEQLVKLSEPPGGNILEQAVQEELQDIAAPSCLLGRRYS